ncbi:MULTISPECIES: MFS transporter [Aeromicrobium]|uniref:MFS transporter n=1 Tax=Aeromicrobium TaxID=2040 RepID=UPI002107411E|nr:MULTISPECIES: MFS transporter [Aeromicrobium]
MTSSPRRTSYQSTYAILAVAAVSFSLLQSMTVPVLPRIALELNTDLATVTWVLTGYLLAAAVATPIIGRLGDAYGKKRMLVISLMFLCLGSLLAAVAPSIEVMITARMISGVGGGVLPLAFGIIRDEFPEHRIGSAASFVSSLMAVGFGLGIVIAGPIIDGLGFDWLFWIPFILTGVAAVATIVFVPESPVRTPGHVPILPAMLLAGWLLVLLLGLKEAPEWGWTSPPLVLTMVAAAAIAATWVAVERRIPVPLVDIHMMKRRGVWTTNLVALLIGFSLYALFGFMPQFLQTPGSTGYGFGLTVTESGLLTLPNAVATFVCGLVAAPLARAIGAKTVVIAGSGIGAGAILAFTQLHETHIQVMIVNGLTGFGTGLVFASLAPLILAAVPPEQSGVANGMNTNIRTIGGAIGAAVMATILTSAVDADGFPLESAYVAAFTVLAAVTSCAGFVGFLIPSSAKAGNPPDSMGPDEPFLAANAPRSDRTRRG